MSKKFRIIVFYTIVVFALCGTIPVSMAAAQEFQRIPIVLRAPDVLPADLLTGPNYSVKGRVTSDGFVNTYDLDTGYGPLRVESTALLLKRINELKALSRIEQLKGTDVYLNAAKQVASGPLKTAQGLVEDPAATVSGVVSGIGKFFGTVSSTLTSSSSYQGNVLDSALGQASYKRAYAYEFGVDPYSSYEPLQKALNDLAWTAAAGGLTVKAAFMAIPGGAGLAVGLTGTAGTLSAMVRDKTPAELTQINQNSLSNMGVPDSAAQAFIMNPTYDPCEQTLLVGALANLSGVANRGLFIEKAAAANEESVAVFLRTRAQLMERYNSKTNSVQRFVNANGIPVIQSNKGKIVALFPLDYVAWTEAFARKEAAVSAAIKQMPGATGKEFWITGKLDPTARKALQARGWKVEDRIRERLLGG
jgi:hypothetical protein